MQEREAQEGSPALAGIDRVRFSGQGTSMGFPRTRGDRPMFVISPESGLWVPPHSRG